VESKVSTTRQGQSHHAAAVHSVMPSGAHNLPPPLKPPNTLTPESCLLYSVTAKRRILWLGVCVAWPRVVPNQIGVRSIFARVVSCCLITSKMRVLATRQVDVMVMM